MKSVDLLLYGYLLVALVRSKCDFPAFVQSRHAGYTWEQRHSSKTVIVAVNQSHMHIKVVCLQNNVSCKSFEYVRICISEVDNDVLLVNQEMGKRTAPRYSTLKRYMCLRIIRRSNAVFQMMTSRPSNAQIEPIQCSIDKLRLDYRPFVSYDTFYDVNEPCFFSGGYSFKIVDNNNRSVCDKFMLPLRIESDCIENDGMTFRFREKNCMGIFKTGKFREIFKLRCLATWTDDSFTFSLVGRGDAMSYWCLRTIRSGSGLNEIYVFNNSDCQNVFSPRSRDFMVLTDFTEHIVTSTCDDQFQYCNNILMLCDMPNKQVFCNKSCGFCQTINKTSNCSFPQHIHGKWKQTTASGDVRMDVSANTISMQPFGNVKCIDYRNSIISRRSLLKRFDNGCYPRYMCLEFDHPSPSVMRYRLGRTLNWPLPEPDSYSNICDDGVFEVNVRSPTDLPNGTPVIAKKPRHHIIDTSSVSHVSCTLPWFVPQTVYFVSSDMKQGCLVHGILPSSHIIIMKYLENGHVSMQYEFVCLASLKSVGEEDRIITKSQENSKYLCWVFYNKFEIRIYPLEDCEGLVQYRNYFSMPKPLFLLRLSENPVPCNVVVLEIESELETLKIIPDTLGRTVSYAQILKHNVYFILFTINLIIMLIHFQL